MCSLIKQGLLEYLVKLVDIMNDCQYLQDNTLLEGESSSLFI